MGAGICAGLIPLIVGSSARESPGHSHEPERTKLGKAKPWQPLQGWSSSCLCQEPFHAWSSRGEDLGFFWWDVHFSCLQSPFFFFFLAELHLPMDSSCMISSIPGPCRGCHTRHIPLFPAPWPGFSFPLPTGTPPERHQIPQFHQFAPGWAAIPNGYAVKPFPKKPKVHEQC